MQPSKIVKLQQITLATLVAGASFTVQGAGFYVGAGALGSQLEPRVDGTSFTVTETQSSGARVIAGLDLSPRFTLEGYYSELGAATLSNQTVSGEIDYTAAGISGLYYLYSSRGSDGLMNREGLMFYGKAGLGFLSNESTSNIEFNRVNREHLGAGLGLEYSFSNGFGFRAEFLNHDADARDISFNLIKRFGSINKATTISSSEEALVPEAPVPQAPEPEVASPETESPEAASEPQKNDPAVTEDSLIAAETITDPSAEDPAVVTTGESNATELVVPTAVPDTDADGVLDDADLCADTLLNAIVDDSGCAFTGILQGLNFGSGSAALSPAATAALDNAIVELSANPALRISVQSHTDNRGNAANNMELSRQRAVSVVRYLSDVGGINLSRMEAVGYGESRPLQSNRTDQGRTANRRVEIEIIK